MKFDTKDRDKIEELIIYVWMDIICLMMDIDKAGGKDRICYNDTGGMLYEYG